MSFLSRRLSSLLHVSLDDEQPVSFLQPLLAWKELMVEHQELSESSLNMIAIAICQKEQEELGEHNRVNFQENSLQHQQKQDKPGPACRRRSKGNSQSPASRPERQGGATASQHKQRAKRAWTQRQRRETKTTKKRKRRSLQSPASSLPRQGGAPASQQCAQSLQRQA